MTPAATAAEIRPITGTESSTSPRRAPGRTALPLARSLALFLGGFGLLSAVSAVAGSGLDGNVWWIDARGLPGWVATPLVGLCAAVLLVFGVHPYPSGPRRLVTVGVAALLTLVALENTVRFYVVWGAGEVSPTVPLPLSLLMAAAWRSSSTRTRGPRGRSRLVSYALTGAALLLCIIAFPLLQMAFFGTTDYRRPAEAIVVFGAQVHEDGRPSTSLVERVQTAVDLFRQGYASTLIVSGGRGTGGVHEADAMRDLAIAGGVPADAIVLDRHGVNTQATVLDTIALLSESGSRRVLAVSHFYHLARIKLAYASQGLDVYTVPTERTRWLVQLPYIIAREIPAFWVYCLRGAGI